MTISTFFQLLFDGLAIGLVYVFMAAGFNLILSVTNVFFIAFAMFYALAAYIAWALVQVNLPFFVCVILATLAAGFGGLLVDVLVMRRIRNGQQPLLKALVASIMLSTILSQAVLMTFGTAPRGINPVFPGHWYIGGVVIAIDRAVMIGISVVVLVGLQVFLRSSRVGRGMRAQAISPEVAALHGVNPPWIQTATFILGLGLAGFAGALMAPTFGIDLTIGQAGFVVLLIIMLGGIGSMVGSILAGIILGLILSFTQFFLEAGVGQIVFFGVVALFFLFRPGGIFGAPPQDVPGEVASLTGARWHPSGWSRWAAAAAALAVLIALPFLISSSYWIHILILVTMYSVLGMTFNLGMRAGMINVAGAAFWGIGAYCLGLFMTKLGIGFWVALPITLVISFAFSLIIGIVICRFGEMLGMMLSIVTASVVPVVLSTFKLFGRATGLSGISPPGNIGPIHFGSITSFYYLVLAFSIISVLIMLAFNKAWTGRAWLSLASSPRLSQSVGVNPFRYRLISFVIMSMIPAFLGTVYASYLGALVPDNFGVFTGVNFLMAAFIGGLSYFVLGSVVGSLVIMLLPELVRATGDWQLIITAVVVILIVMFMPRGVLGSLDRISFRRRPAAVPAVLAAPPGEVAPASAPVQVPSKDLLR